jgi:hypothetical protein
MKQLSIVVDRVIKSHNDSFCTGEYIQMSGRAGMEIVFVCIT